jgi:hypothetical protein
MNDSLEHTLAVEIWNNFIVQALNDGMNYSFNDLERKIKATLDGTEYNREHKQ